MKGKVIALACVILSVFCGKPLFATVPGYTYFKKLTTQEAEISVGSTNLANFPVLVRITDNDLKHTSNGGKVKNTNGFDIVFTGADGTTLVNHQLEKYDGTTGEVVAWVKIPSLSATVNTDLFMYFGNSAVVTSQSSALTWNLNYKAVWHLNSNQNDATLSSINLVSNGATALVPALAANGENLAPSQYLSYPANVNLQLNADMTLEAWLNFNSLQTGVADNVIISCGDVGELGTDNYHYALNLIGSGADAGKLHVFWEHGSGVDVDVISTVPVTPVPGTWHHVAVVRDNTGGTVTFYFDGLQVGTPVSFANAPNFGLTATFQIGQDQNNSSLDIDAGLDEVRISDAARLPEWMQATYQSNRIGSTFISYSTTSCTPPDNANAGPNQTVCISLPTAILTGNTPTLGTGAWALVSGGGSISNTATPITTVSSLLAGDNVFSWTISNGTCTSVSNVTITVDALPSTANAGSNQTLCISNPSTTLNATPPLLGTGMWSIIQGSGSIVAPTSPTTAVNSMSLGLNILQWSVVNGSICAASTSTMSILVDPATSNALAGPNQTLCINSPSTTLAANTPTTGTGSWSVVSGTAVFTNSNSPTTTVNGLSVGTNVLQWNITSVNSCSSTSSSMTIVVDPATSNAVAGSNQTLCINSPSTTLAANTPTTGTGSWSVVSGSAVFTNSNSATTNVSGLALGTNILKWSITSVNSCSSTSSNMTILVQPATSNAVAGPNQTLCINSPSTTLAANTPTTGTGSWSVVSGTAVFTNSNSATTTVNGLSVGTNVLQWNITSVNSCSSTSSSMTIVVDPATSNAVAGPNQTLCINSPSTTLAANTPTTGTGSWSVVSGSAVFTNSNSATTNVSGLSLGTNILKWSITSVNSCSSTSSNMTIVVQPATSNAVAGPNQTLCINSPSTTLAANTPTTGTGSWSVVSGTAVFTNSNSATTTVNGLSVGTNVLQWNITSVNSCSSTSSSMTIVVDPATSNAVAGPNQTLCVNSPSTTLAANTPTTGTGSWSVVSGSAVFTNSNSATTNVSGLSLGTNILKWSITVNSCSSTSSNMTIVVQPATSNAVAGPNQTLCINSPSTTLAANTPTTGTGSWSVVSGTAVFTNSNSATTTVNGLSVGTNVLQWNITSVNSCSSTSSSMTIVVDPATSNAVAGPNQTLCINSPSTTLAANTPTTGTGSWSVVSGSAVFTNSNNPTTTVNGLALGTNILKWSITSVNSCSSTSSNMTIVVQPATSNAVAGPNQTLCINSPSTTLAANTPTTGTGSWSVVSGSAVFTNSNSATTTVNGLSVGTNVLQWNITSVNSCSSTSSSMTIVVDPATSNAVAGPNQTLCINSPSTTLAANTPTTGTGSWSVVSGSAVFTNSNNPITTVTGLSLGTNVLQWNITSVNSCSSTSSSMTIVVQPATSNALAGPNQTLCINSPSTTLAANTPTTGTGSWSVVSGSAVFTNSNSATTTVNGLSLGTNVLQWSITSVNSCSSTSSSMTIVVEPATSNAVAGPNQTLCVNSPSTTLAANTPTTGTGSWSVVSGSAVFTNSNNPTTTVNGLALGTNILKWSITSVNSCSSTSSNMTIVVQPATSNAVAGPNQTLCINSPSTTLAANTPTTGTGSWSVVSGTAVFTNSNSATTTVNGLSLGTNVLQWNITSVNTCSSTSSTMTIEVEPATSNAVAGPNQTLCINSPSTTLAANTPTTGTGSWSVVSGSAVFTNSNNPTTTVNGLALGTNVLQWNITSVNSCSSTSSNMTIVVQPATSNAVAGPNQTLCINSPSTTLAANTPTTGTGSWSVVSGTAVFTNSNNPTTTVNGLSLGTNVLQWNITSVNSCSSTSSTMTIVVDPATSNAVAGPNQTLCINSPSTTLAANTPTTGIGSWTVISGSAVITNSNNPGTTITNLGLGINVLQWNITSVNSCSSTSSNMTIVVQPATSNAVAGPNQTLCINSPSTTLAANTPTAGTGSWSVVSGTAVFTNSNSPTTTVNGLSVGTNVLQWNITSVNTCSSTSSSMTIVVDPATSNAVAGPNQTLCINSPSTTLAANTPTTGTGSWSVVSGSAVFTNSNNPATTVNGLGLGTNVLQWNITSVNSCSSTSSSMTIVVEPATSNAVAGPNQTLCINSPSTTLAANTPTTGIGSWSVVSGTAVFTNSNSATTIVNGLSLGTNVLQWSITSVNSCSSTSSTMTIVVEPATSNAVAGPNQTLCINSPSTTLAANTPTTGIGSWTVVSGSAVITNSNNPGTTVTNLGLGINVLQWNITSVNSCSSTSSSMTIIVQPATSNAVAGPNQTLCINSPSTTLAANTPTTGTGSWSVVSGSAVFTNSNSATTTVNGLSLGINVLQWNITSVNTCSSTSSTMTIVVDPATSNAVAGPNQTLCINSPSTTLAANTPTTGTGSWSVVSGSAVFTNSNNPTTTVNGLALGTNVLQWNITSVNSCSSTSSSMTIIVQPATSNAAAGPNQTLCINSPSTTLAANTPTTGIGSWSVVSGTAVFTNSNSATTAVNGLSLGTNVLKWSITSVNTCSSTSSTMTIIVQPAASNAVAGPNQTLCINSPSTTLAANIPTLGVGSWSLVSGSAVFTNSNNPITTVTGLGLGINVLQWNIASVNTCSSTSSSMTVIVQPATSNALAGPNQTLCINSPSTTLAANTPTTGLGSWTVVSGSAVFTNSNSPTTIVNGLALGTNVLKWNITSVNTCSSTSSNMTVIVQPATSNAVAGPNQTLCINSPSTALSANIPTLGIGSWSLVSGSAVFTNSNNPGTVVSGLALGTNILQWNITSVNTCSSTASSMTIDVQPAASNAVAGPNQTLCINSPSTTLAANTPTTGLGSWTVVSGSAVFTNSNSPTTAVNGLSLGTNVLKWNITSVNTCSSTSSNMTVIVQPATSNAVAGPNQTLCINSPSTSLAANVPTTGVGSWSLSSGSAVFTSSNNPLTTVTGLGLGTNVLQWNITSVNTCSSTSSTMTVIVNQLSSAAVAGPNQTLCATSTSTVLAATSPVSGVGTWSLLSGSGNVVFLNNNNSPVTSLGIGLNVLQWSVKNGVCPANTNTMSIQVDVNPPTTPVAGPNQTICINSASVTLTGNAPSAFAGLGTWSVTSGSGSIAAVNSATTTVTNLAVGTNVLRWTIANACGSSASSMSVQVDQMPTTANAGPNLTDCSLAAPSYTSPPTFTLGGNVPSVGTGTWAVLTGTAFITGTNTANSTATTQSVGNNILQWSIGNGVCPASTSTMQIHIDSYLTGIPAGPNQTICILSPSTTLAAVQPSFGVNTWTVLIGTGVVANPTLATSVVTNLSLGLNKLQWSAFNGACPQSLKLVDIQVDPAPSTASISTPNQTICSTGSVTSVSANSSTVAGETQSWSFIQGGGSIANNTLATTAVTLNMGTNVLQWSIGNGGACPNSVATVTLVVVGVPSTANAGSNQTICISSPSTTLAALTPTGGIGTWSFVTGSGVITSVNSPTSTVTGLAAGLNVLRWTLSSPCTGPNSSTMSIQVDAAPATATAGPSQTVCASTATAPLSAANATGTWSVLSGAGVITNSNTPTTSITGLITGTTILQWKTTNGVCSSTSTMAIVVNNAPTTATTAGNQSLCISTPSTTLTGNTPSSGTGIWSIVSGPGTVSTPTLATSTLTALTTGTTVLAWTISNNGCPPSVANMTVQVFGLPGIANAGTNQTVCASTGTTTMAANTPTAGSGAWSVVSGPGSIGSVNNPNTSITGLTTPGTTVLQWAFSNGPCTSISTVTIQIDNAPTPATVAGNQSLCITSPSTTLTGNIPSVGTGSWTLISGSGAITTPTLGNSTITGLTTGTTVLQWTTKFGTCVSNSPTMSIAVFNPPGTATVSSSQTICASTPSLALTASSPTLGTGTWSVISGGGVFTSSTSPATTVSALPPGANVLQWALSNGACSDVATMTIQVDNIPTAPLAGPDQSLCISVPNTTLAGNVPSIGTGNWSTISGTGIVVTPTLATSPLTGLGVGTLVLGWTTVNGVCTSTTSTVSIVVYDVPGMAYAGADQTICINSSSATLSANTPTLGTGLWTILAGGGTVTTPTLENSTITGLTSGTNQLEWKLINGACSNTSTVSIQVDDMPDVAVAGSNQSLCISSPTLTLAANTPTLGTGLWSVVSGTATVVNPTLATSTATNLTIGVTVLEWSIFNGVCPSSSSTMSIEVFNLASTAIAGSDQTICVSTGSTTLSGNTPTVGVGSWSLVTGSGSITSVNSETTTVTSLSVGVNVFEWAIVNGGCSSTSTMAIQVDALPDVSNAGPSQSLCINSPSATLAANAPVIGTGQWSVVTGTGTVTTPTLANSTVTGLSPGANILQWTTSNGVCASSVSSTTLDVNSLATVANAGVNQTICISTGSTTLSGNTPTIGTGSWSLVSGTGSITSIISESTTVTGLGSGDNIFAWTITNGGCSNSATVAIHVDDLPDNSNAGPSQTICVISPSTTLAANVPVTGAGSWSVLTGGGTVTTPTLASSTVTGLSAGINILEWTIANGVCAVSSSTTSIQVDIGLVTAVAGPNQTLCVSTPTTSMAAATPTLGTGIWSLLTGVASIITPTSETTAITSLVPGTHVFEWTVTNGGCSNSATMSIQVDDVPDPAFAGSNQTLCISTPSTALAANSLTTGTGTWSVISGSGVLTGSVAPTTTINSLSAGNNAVVWTITNGVCAPTTSTVNIQVDNLATTANAGSNQTLCASSPSTTLSGNVPTVGNGLWTIVSGGGTVTTPTLSNSTVTGLLSGTNVIEWNITNGSCSSSASVSIFVDEVPDVALAGSDQTLCISNPTATLSANTPTLGTGTWSVLSGSGSITSPNNPGSTITGLSAGSNVLQWTVSNGVCTANTSTMNIQVDNSVSLSNAGSNQTVCISSASTTLAGNTPTLGTGTWSIISGSGAIATATLPTTAVSNLGAGINVLQWNISNGSCTNSSTMSIQVDGLPDAANAGSNQTLCISSPAATLAAITPTLGSGTWSVITGTGTIASPALPASAITGLNTGTTVLQWSVINGVCAASAATMQIVVDDLPTTALAGPDQTICATSATLAANVPSIGTGAWSVITGNASVTNSLLANTDITAITSATTTLQWSISNGACAASIATVNIFMASPTGVFAGNNKMVCAPDYTMAATAPASGSGAWTLASGSATIVNPADPLTPIANLGYGSNLFIWTITNGSCPIVSDTVMIDRGWPADTAKTGNDTIINVNIFALHGNSPLVGTGQWELVSGYGIFTDYLNNNCTVNNLAAGVNIIRWKITGACDFTEDDIRITVTDLMLPNAISPNGDGKNDVFEVPGIATYSRVELVIFNRWGSVVFEDKNYKNNWGGTNSQNAHLTEDTYYYTLKLDDSNKSGFIIIKR